MSVSVDNPYNELQQSPIEGKEDWRSRKDDIKEQAFQAKEGVKAKAIQLKEEVLGSQLLDRASKSLASGVQFAKQKAADMTGKPEIAQKSNEQLVADAKQVAEGEWETVKSRGGKLGKKALNDASEKASQLADEKLTPAQKAKLSRGLKTAQVEARQANRKAAPLFNKISSFWPIQLRGLRTWIQRNNLELPAMICMTFMTLWLGLTMIRIITTLAMPKVPEFDIHSKEATLDWAKYHAGELKGKASELSDSWSGRVAKFLANHEVDKLKESAMQKADLWREIGMQKLGLAEPTYSERMWAWVTGRPLTWQGRVEHVLELAKLGLSTSAAAKLQAAKETLGMQEPSFTQRVINKVTGRDDTLAGRAQQAAKDSANSFGERVSDGIDSIRNGAEYVKNRVVHGAQEAAHIAQDRANELADNVKYKTGL